MAIPNKISGAVDDAAYTEITTAINTIKEKLPFLVDLSVEEIRELPKFGDKSVAFVQKARDLVELNSDFLPRSFNIRLFNEDVVLYETLSRIVSPLRMLVEKIEDTRILAGSEAYAAALVVYSSAKNARGDLGGLETVLDDLSKRFARKSTTEEESEPA